jgi:hypothetical protein
MTAADELTAVVFRALYAEYDLCTFGILHVVTPKGTPVYAGDSLGQIARQLSDHEAPDPDTPGPRQATCHAGSPMGAPPVPPSPSRFPPPARCSPSSPWPG